MPKDGKHHGLTIAAGLLGGVYALMRIAAAKQNAREDEELADNTAPSISEKHTLDSVAKKENVYISKVKPAIDHVLSFGALVALSPLYAALAFVVKLDDPGPAIFTQKRIGENQRLFMLHKFRTMKMDAPHDVPTHLLENPDAHITHVGKILRKMSLDELPQIWDIFRGKIAIVGPRPALWNQYDLMELREENGSASIRPGITGLAQVNGRDELPIVKKAGFDGEYARILRAGGFTAFKQDTSCLVKTCTSVLKADGIVEGNQPQENKKYKKIAVMSSHTPSLWWFRIDMMCYFQSLGYEVVAIGNESATNWVEKFAAHGIRYLSANISRNSTNPLDDIKTLKTLFDILKNEKPDKVFCYQAKTIVYGSIAAKANNISDVYPLIAGLGSMFLAEDFKSRVIRSVMCSEYKIALKNCPKVFFQNSEDSHFFEEKGLVDCKQISMLHGSGVNIKQFSPTAFPEHPTFLCICRLIRDKGVFEYLAACRELKQLCPEARCILIGPYDTNPSSIRSIDINPFIEEGTIEYKGEQEDVRPFLAQCSTFVLPSYREGTPKTVLEAMACGRPVITTDTPGCKETIVDGESGFLVPAKSVSALVEKMHWLANHMDNAKRMGEAARERAIEFFDVNKVNKTIAAAMKLI